MGSVIAPFVGADQARQDRDAANAARQQGLAQWTGLSAPDIASQQLAFQNYQNAGDYQTQNEQALQQGPSAMQGVSTDPRLVDSQMAALNQLSQTGQMGMTPAEAAALKDAQRQASSMAQAKSSQLMDEYARRGMGGSGNELAARLQAGQSGADRASQNSNQVMQMAQQRALQALGQAGQLGGQMRGQEFGEKSDIAKAKDYINRFNTENSQNVQHTNVQNANQAALRNLNNKQGLMGQNTQLSNQQQQANKALIQQQFNNQTALAAGRSGQYAGIAQNAQQNAANTANMWAGIGQGVDTGLGAAYKYGQNNQQAPTTDNANSGFSEKEQNDWLNSGNNSGGGYGSAGGSYNDPWGTV